MAGHEFNAPATIYNGFGKSDSIAKGFGFFEENADTVGLVFKQSFVPLPFPLFFKPVIEFGKRLVPGNSRFAQLFHLCYKVFHNVSPGDFGIHTLAEEFNCQSKQRSIVATDNCGTIGNVGEPPCVGMEDEARFCPIRPLHVGSTPSHILHDGRGTSKGRGEVFGFTIE